MDEISYLVGLDLGQARDFTALAILERSAHPVRAERTFAVRHLERFPLGTSYPMICDRLVALFAQQPLSGATLVVDQTGVGRAVIDMICRARPRATIRPITITAGHEVVPDGLGWHVPKKDLVGALQVLIQTHRLQVARMLSMASVLVKELETFRVKITISANETFESWRERDHDDLVLAVAMAAWVGDRGLQELWIRW
jgi:threonine dehydrogenase-like Zn-dependent dehydrogenase